MKSPITDALATITIMLALIAGGYLYLTYQADKVLQHKSDKISSHSEIKGAQKIMLSGGNNKKGESFEFASKRTE